MRLVPLALVIATLCTLIGSHTSAAPRYVRHVMGEDWTGLTGTVLLDGKEKTLPKLVWDRQSVLKPRLKDGPPGTPREIDYVTLRVRGTRITRGRPNQVLEKSEFDGYCLCYPLEGEPGPLTLSKDAGKSAQWRWTEPKEPSPEVRRTNFGRGSGYYSSHTESSALEARNRPGWFLTVDEGGRLTLSNVRPPKHVVTVKQSLYFDDENDGK